MVGLCLYASVTSITTAQTITVDTTFSTITSEGLEGLMFVSEPVANPAPLSDFFPSTSTFRISDSTSNGARVGRIQDSFTSSRTALGALLLSSVGNIALSWTLFDRFLPSDVEGEPDVFTIFSFAGEIAAELDFSYADESIAEGFNTSIRNTELPVLFGEATAPDGSSITSISLVVVPEPTSIVLVTLGGLSLLGHRKRK